MFERTAETGVPIGRSSLLLPTPHALYTPTSVEHGGSTTSKGRSWPGAEKTGPVLKDILTGWISGVTGLSSMLGSERRRFSLPQRLKSALLTKSGLPSLQLGTQMALLCLSSYLGCQSFEFSL